MPTGPNRIPKMSQLMDILSMAGYKHVQTYIQSGNIILDTEKSKVATAEDIRMLIKESIGADLHVIMKSVDELGRAINESPYRDTDDPTCVFLVLSNNILDPVPVHELQQTDFGQEKLFFGKESIHLWLPWDVKPKRLNNAFLEKRLGIVSTMRNIRVATKIYELAIK
jgi:uncharacterized protein (DUF1697 family)